MKRRFSLFTYPRMDMKAAEAELNRRAAAGWTAEWCRRQLGAAGQPPLEGYEGVWHIRSGERTETADRGESGWVLQRGNTLFRMKGGALPDEMWLDEVLSRLEGETGGSKRVSAGSATPSRMPRRPKRSWTSRRSGAGSWRRWGCLPPPSGVRSAPAGAGWSPPGGRASGNRTGMPGRTM